MAEVILFHHAQGLTDGVGAFADDLRAAGHVVHTPDLYEGRTFTVPRRTNSRTTASMRASRAP